MTHDDHQVLDIWSIHARINLDILDTLSEADLALRLEHYETTAGGQFAHIHRVRILWLRRQPELAEGLTEIDPQRLHDKAHLRANLAASAERVAQMLAGGLDQGGQLPFFEPHLAAFIGYLVAHECMHHGEIGMILGSAGKTLPLEVVWNWNQV